VTKFMEIKIEYSAFRIMFAFFLFLLALLTSGFTASAYAAELGSFEQVETETLDGEDFVFPDDFRGVSLNIVMLAMSNEQDNGSWQGDALTEWYTALEAQDVLSDDVLGYHFSVMKVPFFIKGIVRSGMAKTYKDKMPLDQAGAIFTKDLDAFAKAPGLKLDGQPTLVLVAPDGELLEVFKGEVSPDGIAAVSAAVNAYLQVEAGSAGSAASD